MLMSGQNEIIDQLAMASSVLVWICVEEEGWSCVEEEGWTCVEEEGRS